MSLLNPSCVAQVVLPGTADPAEVMNDYKIQWKDKTINKFREVKIPRKTDDALALPTMYLHFLDESFRIPHGQLDTNLRAGNDIAEVIMKLPAEYFAPDFADKCLGVESHVKKVVDALRRQGEVPVWSGTDGWKANPDSLFFSLSTARPKAGISIDNKAFGIPTKAHQYVFANNHSSVGYFDQQTRDAFNHCIMELPDIGKEFEPARRFLVFLKLFYQGGFAYNEKVVMNGGYLPRNVGVAAISTVPAFKGQAGLDTGFPYQLPEQFLRFVDTVPISIEGIKSMSEQHSRYGMCFTRAVFIWEGDAFDSEQTLDFCSIVPHGGFYYVPDSLEKLREIGGLVYAFTDAKQALKEMAASLASTSLDDVEKELFNLSWDGRTKLGRALRAAQPVESLGTYHLFYIVGAWQSTAVWNHEQFSDPVHANAAFVNARTHSRALIFETATTPPIFYWSRAWVPRLRWHQGALVNWVQRKLGAMPQGQLEAILNANAY